MVKNLAYLGLGSNLENPQAQLMRALRELDEHKKIELLKTSHYYQTKPVGPQDQPDFINAVCLIQTDLSALDLLDVMQDTENRHGRVRTVHWGARTLDLDLLLYNDEIIDHPRLTVPHPEMVNRAFVLVPLSDLDENLTIPNSGNIQKLLEQVDQSGIERVINE